jgi:hypothetical protein
LCIKPAREFDHLYFPNAGFSSLRIVSRDGRLVDTALVGREGVLGPMAVQHSNPQRPVHRLQRQSSLASSDYSRGAIQILDRAGLLKLSRAVIPSRAERPAANSRPMRGQVLRHPVASLIMSAAHHRASTSQDEIGHSRRHLGRRARAQR